MCPGAWSPGLASVLGRAGCLEASPSSVTIESVKWGQQVDKVVQGGRSSVHGEFPEPGVKLALRIIMCKTQVVSVHHCTEPAYWSWKETPNHSHSTDEKAEVQRG